MRKWTRLDNIIFVDGYEAAWTDDTALGDDANTIAQFIVDALNAAEERAESGMPTLAKDGKLWAYNSQKHCWEEIVNV